LRGDLGRQNVWIVLMSEKHMRIGVGLSIHNRVTITLMEGDSQRGCIELDAQQINQHIEHLQLAASKLTPETMQ
jgi:hypothetical protein